MEHFLESKTEMWHEGTENNDEKPTDMKEQDNKKSSLSQELCWKESHSDYNHCETSFKGTDKNDEKFMDRKEHDEEKSLSYRSGSNKSVKCDGSKTDAILDGQAGSGETEKKLKLSELPIDVLGRIIGCLDCKEAAMVACTCRSLLAAWRTYPHFSLYLGGSPDSNLLAAITSNLVNHQEHTLSGLTLLGSQQPISAGTIEQWFTILLEHQKGSFSLNFSFQFQWFLPVTIFEFRKLCSLSLTNCTIELVHGFSFPFLKKLTLRTCTFIDESTNSLELLIAGCPKVKEIKVKEPNLPDGGVYSATAIKAPLLTCLTLILGFSAMNWTVFSTDVREMHIETGLSVCTDFLQQFRNVTSLFVQAHSIMGLLTFTFEKLQNLSLEIYDDGIDLGWLFDVLGKAPNLSHLEFTSNDTGSFREDPAFWALMADTNFPRHFKYFHMKEFTGTDREYDILTFLINKLHPERVTITLHRMLNVLRRTLEDDPFLIEQDPIHGLESLTRTYPSVHFQIHW